MQEEEQIEQPERFDLELELVRWVKIAVSTTIPPVMAKPSGPITQHYGLDSKSRWREAVCVMMLAADPHIDVDGTNKLGRQLAQLFRQDLQLWEVKARQLNNWVKRGLTNVKLLDRTLAYFQNQSSWLQYIKNLKHPIPIIETPGFPGTQWSEYYWKEQTVMLLMQEHDFPHGKDPAFCARLFGEETGKWTLKMEQFKRWLEKGKSDPLPEYYGTGKNCPECGLFLWDARSFLKHMKRNHGLKIRDKEREKEKSKKESTFITPPSLVIPAGEPSDPDDSPMHTPDNVPQSSTAPARGEEKPVQPAAAAAGGVQPALQPSSTKNGQEKEVKALSSYSSAEKSCSPSLKLDSKAEPVEEEPSLLSLTLPVRSAACRKEPPQQIKRNKLVSCPECNYRCSHSKIVSHLIKCKKAHQANKPDHPPNPADKDEKANSTTTKSKVSAVTTTYISPIPPRIDPKKVFWKKYEAEQRLGKDRMASSSPEPACKSPEPYKSPDSTAYISPEQSYRSPDPYKPPLKLKLSRKEGCQENPCFEINKPIISSLLRQNYQRFSPTPPREAEPSPRSPSNSAISSTVGTSSSSTVPVSVPKVDLKLRVVLDRSEAAKAEALILKKSKKSLFPKVAAISTSDPTNPLLPESSNTESNRSNPESSASNPKSSVSNPKSTATNPKSSASNPKSTATNPESSASKPESSVSNPKSSAPNPESKEECITNENQDEVSSCSKLNPVSDDGRHSLRRGRMLSCPLCGSEYAIASNLEKHINRDHKDIDKPAAKRRSAGRKSVDVTPPKKMRKNAEVKSQKENSAQLCSATDGTSANADVSGSQANITTDPNAQENTEKRKMTEYEIFQSLQLGTETKSEKRKIACNQCDKLIPPNNIKRHLEKHAKASSAPAKVATQPSPRKPPALVKCDVCSRMLKKNVIKKHLAKHRREGKAKRTSSAPNPPDDRVPCDECGKMLPKNAMKRHMMKHEVERLDPADTSALADVKPEIEASNDSQPVATPAAVPEKKRMERKKISCQKCGLQCAPNTMKRHLDKHRREEANVGEVYAPIEITPTKEYWEMQGNEVMPTEQVKTSLEKSFQEPTNMDEKEDIPDKEENKERSTEHAETREETTVIIKEEEPETKVDLSEVGEDQTDSAAVDTPAEVASSERVDKIDNIKQEEEKKTTEGSKDPKSQERGGKASGSDEEGENPLDVAVRKVVSYKMTPKQALSIYNLTPKVLFDNLLGETDQDRMSILSQVDLTSAGEQKVIQFCRKHEDQLSYKSVINYVKELKHRDGDAQFTLTRLQAYRWWYAFRKKFDLKITAKKK